MAYSAVPGPGCRHYAPPCLVVPVPHRAMTTRLAMYVLEFGFLVASSFFPNISAGDSLLELAAAIRFIPNMDVASQLELTNATTSPIPPEPSPTAHVLKLARSATLKRWSRADLAWNNSFSAIAN
jgi:hypothetical protein